MKGRAGDQSQLMQQLLLWQHSLRRAAAQGLRSSVNTSIGCAGGRHGTAAITLSLITQRNSWAER